MKKYWIGLDELDQTSAFQKSATNEFATKQAVDEFLSGDQLSETSTGRRDFLKFMGFSLAAATLAACETPVVKSIPYVVKPEDIVPGVANFYAATFYDGNDFGNILVKTREGRPIFIKGNTEFGIAKGAVSARVNSSVLGLYDGSRLRNPRKNNADITWEDLDNNMKGALAAAASIRILSHTVISPSTQRAINDFSAKYTGKVKHIQYDTYSYSGITKANLASFGKAVIPAYDFSKAKTIVSIAADFLGTWITPSVYQVGYTENRKPENGWINKHYQFESAMSLTGSNCDERFPIKPSQEGRIAAALYNALSGAPVADGEGVDAQVIGRIAADLKANAGNSLVVAGSNDVNIQIIVNAINQLLGNYGKTIDLDHPLNLFQGKEEDMASLIDEMNNGSVDVLLVYGTNPAYSWNDPDQFTAALAKVKTSVSFNLFADETASRCTYQAPDHHYLESWNDYSMVKDRIDLTQPTITPLYNTRPAQESFLKWADNPSSYYDYLRTTYNSAYTPALMKADKDWHIAVHNGTFPSAVLTTIVAPASETPTITPIPVADAIAAVSSVRGGEWETVFYQKVTIGVGNYANNPFLQETPDPITKVTWDNYVTMSPADVKEKGLALHLGQDDEASVVTVSIQGKNVTLPVFPSPGQTRGTIGIALGYGRGSGNEEIGKAAYQSGEKGEHLIENGKRVPIGKNAFPLVTVAGGQFLYTAYSASIQVEKGTYPLASTQMHNTVMGRDSVVKETTIGNYLSERDKKKGTASWNMAVTLPVHADVNGDGKINSKDRQPVGDSTLWREHPVEGVGHRWGMTIDLGACIGCSACVTACHIENNVPVVGKDEVRRHRDMHWLRIDRYFSSDYDTLEETREKKNLGTIAAYGDMENPTDNPRTVHMPMMCQHCNHAPCETVCPVAATTHSDEGLNNMAYNRCIGTRYCANNCPYKVRRFNWLNYVTNDKFANVNPAQDDTLRLMLNPDVTVRARGVMEKCSMCQQRIQAGKLDAKKAGKPVQDGAIQTACAEACPTHAIVFGDLNDSHSENAIRSENNRSYRALEETGVQPNVYYMTKVRNIEETEA